MSDKPFNSGNEAFEYWYDSIDNGDRCGPCTREQEPACYKTMQLSLPTDVKCEHCKSEIHISMFEAMKLVLLCAYEAGQKNGRGEPDEVEEAKRKQEEQKQRREEEDALFGELSGCHVCGGESIHGQCHVCGGCKICGNGDGGCTCSDKDEQAPQT